MPAQLLLLPLMAGCWLEYDVNGKDKNPNPGSTPFDTDSPFLPDTDDTEHPGICSANESESEKQEPDKCLGDEPRGQGTKDITLEWSWTGATSNAAVDDISVTPVAAPIWDMNHDGVIERTDIPAIIFPASDGGSNAMLIALEGTGATRWELSSIDGSPPDWQSTPAIADLEWDWEREILVVLADGRVAALGPDGVLKWVSSETVTPGQTISVFAGLTEEPRILVGDLMLDKSGQLITRATGPTCANDISWAGDIDANGTWEWISHGAAWPLEGPATWTFSSEAFCYTTPFRETSTSDPMLLGVHDDERTIVLLDLDGGVQWTWTADAPVGPPAVGDPDGDGEWELVLTWGGQIWIYDLTEGLYSVYAGDADSGRSGCVLADLDSDGIDEIAFAADDAATVFNAATGQSWLYETSHSSGGGWKTPIIVDLDVDGSAEVLFVAEDHNPSQGTGSRAGLYVYGNPDNGWQEPGRKLWPQHAYDPNQVDEDGELVFAEKADPSETFRRQVSLPSPQSWALELLEIDACADSCDPLGLGEFSYAIKNRGGVEAGDAWVTLLDRATGARIEQDDIGWVAPGEIQASRTIEVDWSLHDQGLILQPAASGWTCTTTPNLEIQVPCP